ncbi:MAG TPA: PspA/IM30 family protein [Candidatus Fimimorpha faecalis]|uniref:PspA/IM30 family protein n=1 Tax=Candidatus Fimimorpha faecalis TaxID=2840824 RepID=A0A9D1JCS5_9FIRM|nr:PspA/IM30 family protein [Candidatus Fimimorpha faecalis]
MGVIQRFKDIMSANVNAVLDKAEDPEKMIDQYMRNLQDDLGKVKAETAAVMAEETRAKRELDECNQEVEKLQKYAEKAVAAGNDSDARLFLQKKQTVAAQQIALRQAYDSASANAAKMRQMHDKIVKDMENLNQRKAAIKAKVAAAKAQERVNQIGGSLKGVSNHMSAFDRMEEKANKMLDQANAMAELNEAGQEDSIEDLMSKYDDGSSSNVEDELAALKAKMSGKTEASEQTSGVEDELEALKAKLNTQ